VSAPALALRGIHKRFGETIALDGAHCVVAPGTVHALLGENGAGKSTLMRVAFGLVPADAGRVERDGSALAGHSTRDAIAAGVGMVHQHFELVPAFTVAENAALGGRGAFRAEDAEAVVQRVSAFTGLAIDARARVRDLSVGAQQRAELIRALAHDARVLILDEPTSVLTPTEAEELYGWMRRFAANGGTIVLITHKVREALAIADQVTVLRRGRTVLEGASREMSEDAVVAAIVGEAPLSALSRPAATASPSEVVFALSAAAVLDARGVPLLRPTSLTVRRGEVLGVLGVDGAGQRELLRLLAGRLEPTSGNVARPPRVGFVPEDRLHDAVIPDFTLVENRTLADATTLRRLISWTHETAATQDILDVFDVRARSVDARMRELSGGNQQKFVIGRETALAPAALVAENPTRGLDVRAAARVWSAVRELAYERGGAAVVYSADMDEILALTRRVVVCHAGNVVEVPPPADVADRSPYARALVGAPEGANT
jgi:ABC-type uncharacterized transport system ATPase subunit